MTELELWGGHECTVNRVGSSFHDQTRRSGHQDRIADLELFADLGLKALRYPVLWERIAPTRPDRFDWSWSDERLTRIRELGMRPIAGLVHHGSGPKYTGLVDEGFAPGLAGYARAVAERYPWIDDWTPVNEPLTTARFSCLYGHWYPHLTDEGFFWSALINQIDGVRLAMQQIRQVNPKARLIQTEDLGRTYSTRAVAHQASFDNARRWMTWDLLCGKVTPEHPLWARLCGFGFQRRLEEMAAEPCPPDVLGVNHYLTSDRFLDHRCEEYPPERCGGNDSMRYADVEAIRVALPAPGGLEGVLEEAWVRYGLPLAVTEAHNGCTREEQVRWLRDAWDAAQRLRDRGVPIEAVTAWALLGSYDWNTLLTRKLGHYEPGVFDLRGPEPRATAAAAFLKSLTHPEIAPHPVSQGPGWWRRDIRLVFRPVFRTVET
ncbi:MAG TPA: family 1 glycosylhydrolase, partial [Phenylobacterium sp.]